MAEKILAFGSQVSTSEYFTYGKFDCFMKPAFGSGVVSSMFLFYDQPDFRTNWGEVDFEILGKNCNLIDTNVIRTLNGVTDMNVNVKHNLLTERSSDRFWKLTLEWRPSGIVWLIDDVPVRTIPVNLTKPMRLMFNAWAKHSAWSGELNIGVLPQQAEYQWVRVWKYVNGEFVFAWQDKFDTLKPERWMAGNWQIGNTLLLPENVSTKEGKLVLSLL